MHTTEQLSTALAGRYAVDRLIGEGGMATVYLARDVRHNRRVALKVLRPDLGAILGAERFLSEIEVTANLQHPNLLPLFDSGEASGLLFYVMPFVEGESLRKRLEREKQLPIEEAVHIAAAIAGALDYAHRHGVIHRDLKPENILLHDGQPLVADFGIALAVSNAGGNRITQTGLSLGTPEYMSPEQATGDRELDARSDVYALGAVMYEMLTGEAPHTGKTSQAIIARVLTERHRPVHATRPNVPAHVEAAIDCALEKLAPDRFATAKEFGEAITGVRVLTRTGTSAHQAVARSTTAAVLGPEQRRPAKRELAAWGLAAVAVAIAGTSALRPKAQVDPPPSAHFRIEMPDSTSVSSAGGVGLVALSRDGTELVFHGTEAGELQALYLRRLGDPTVVKIRGTEGARTPVLSPDGTEVMFSPLGTATIKRVSVAGGSPRTVIDSAGSIAWGDQHQILFTRGGGIWIAGEDGSSPRRLARPDTALNQTSLGRPEFLPGGRAALIEVRMGRNAPPIDSARIGVITIPEGKVTVFDIHGLQPRYTAQGQVFFANADGVVLAAPFSPAQRRFTAAPVQVIEGVGVGTGGAAAFAVSQTGTIVYLPGVVNGGRRRLVAVDRSGKEQDLGTRLAQYMYPRLSPNGRELAVTIFTDSKTGGKGSVRSGTSQSGPNPDIWRFELDSKAWSRVTADSASVRPAWSPDGERIAFAGIPLANLIDGDSTVRWRPLYIGAKPEVLIRAGLSVASVAMGPRHGYMAFVTSHGGNTSDILVAHIDSTQKPRPLIANPYDEYSPTISPDGRYIAYVTNRTGRPEVYLQTLPNGGPELPISETGGTEPVWAREGNELFYRDADVLVSVKLSPGSRPSVASRQRLFRDVYWLGRISNYDVFPGAKEFVMIRGELTARDNNLLTVITNWKPASTTGAQGAAN